MHARLVIRRDDSSDAVRVTRRGGRGISVVTALGAAFTLVGLARVALLWVPLRLDSTSWQLETAGQTLDGLAVAVLGLGLLAYAAVRDPGPAKRFGLSFLLAVSAFLMVGLAYLFATAALEVWGQTPPERMPQLRESLLRGGVAAAVYPVLLAYLAAAVWRAGGKA